MIGHVFVEPDALLAAAAELDAVAVRLADAVGAATAATGPPPAGGDEVSLLAARYFWTAARSLDPAAAAAIGELHETAAALRAQAAAYTDVDRALGGALAGSA